MRETDGLPLWVGVAAGDPLWDAVIVRVRPDVTVDDGDWVALSEGVPLRDGVPLDVAVFDALEVGACDELGDGACVPVWAWLGDEVTDWDGACEELGERESVRDGVVVGVHVPDVVTLLVIDEVAEAVRSWLPVWLNVGDAVPEVVCA